MTDKVPPSPDPEAVNLDFTGVFRLDELKREPQHITPRFIEAELAQGVAPLHAEIARMKAALAAAKSAPAGNP